MTTTTAGDFTVSNSPLDPPLDIGIGGMTCASCVARVEKALKKVPGVQTATANLATESARIVYAPGEQMEARLRRAVRDAGYEPRAASAALSCRLMLFCLPHRKAPWELIGWPAAMI